MKNEINFYINEFENLYKGSPWLDVTLMSVLRKVDYDTAFKKPSKKVHSIAEIVCHIIDYRKFLIAQFEINEKFDVNQRLSFDTSRYAVNKIDDWKNIIQTLENTQKSIIKSLKNAGTDTLERKVFHRRYNIKYLTESIIQHDIYHMGQLMLLLRIYKR